MTTAGQRITTGKEDSNRNEDIQPENILKFHEVEISKKLTCGILI